MVCEYHYTSVTVLSLLKTSIPMPVMLGCGNARAIHGDSIATHYDVSVNIAVAPLVDIVSV